MLQHTINSVKGNNSRNPKNKNYSVAGQFFIFSIPHRAHEVESEVCSFIFAAFAIITYYLRSFSLNGRLYSNLMVYFDWASIMKPINVKWTNEVLI